MDSSNNKPFFLSPIDNTMPTTYVPTLLLFPVAEADTENAVAAFLNGLRRMFQAMPLLTGSIKGFAKNGPQMGSLAVTSPWRTAEHVFKAKDLRKSHRYNYVSLRERGFPPSAFPIWDFVMLDLYADYDPPAMHVQITLIEGGLVLASCFHHCLADGSGTAAITRIWAACCRDETPGEGEISRLWQRPSELACAEKSSLEEVPEYTYLDRPLAMSRRSYVENGNQQRSLSLVSLLKRRIEALCKPSVVKLAASAIMKYQSWNLCTRLLWFPHADLLRLKKSAAMSDTESDAATWISTTDALSALLFCCITQSRLAAKSMASSASQSRAQQPGLSGWLYHFWASKKPPLSEGSALLLTASNVRKHCQPPAPPDFIGNLFLLCNVQSKVEELVPSVKNVAKQARKLRGRLRALDGDYLKRAVAALRSVPDITKVSWTGGQHPELCLILSSWRDQDICSLDWGPAVGTRCERVRICNFFLDGLVIIFPEYVGSQPDGGLEVVVSLDKRSMRELERNDFFNDFARWRESSTMPGYGLNAFGFRKLFVLAFLVAFMLALLLKT